MVRCCQAMLATHEGEIYTGRGPVYYIVIPMEGALHYLIQSPDQRREASFIEYYLSPCTTLEAHVAHGSAGLAQCSGTGCVNQGYQWRDYLERVRLLKFTRQMIMFSTAGVKGLV